MASTEKELKRRKIIKWSLTAAILATVIVVLGLIIIMHFSL
jgi:hypothetical protein